MLNHKCVYLRFVAAQLRVCDCDQLYYNGSHTFLKFRRCVLQNFFNHSRILFLSINFHAKPSEKQKKDYPVRRCLIKHNLMRRFIRKPRPLGGPPEITSQTQRRPQSSV